MIPYGYIPPQNKELESAVLGAILLEKSALDTVVGILKPEMFYVTANQIIYETVIEMSGRYVPVDMLTLLEELKSKGQLEAIGGPFYVMEITKNVVSSANTEAHARIIAQKYISREIIRICGSAVKEAFQDGADPFDQMETLGNDLFQLSSGYVKRDFKAISVEFRKEMKEISIRMQKRENITGIPSGFPSIDAITYGWQKTDLIILAARPSVGKTAFALNLARNAAYHPHKPTNVGFFSLEMSNSQLVQRLMAAESDIRLAEIRNGKMEDWQYDQLGNRCANIIKDCIYIDDTPALNIFELRTKARRMRQKHNVGLIILDYLQLMSGEGNKGNREQEISQISRQLKTLAKELEVPIIALSQLSRDVEKRGGQVPQLSDLRESGAIEQDADVVAFLYRTDYQKEDHQVDPSVKGDTYIKFAKHRNGQLETIIMKAMLSVQRFVDISMEQEQAFIDGYADRHPEAGNHQTEMPF